MRQLRVLSGAATLCAALIVNQPAEAGFGLFGNHGGHGSNGSSGGYAVGVGYGGSSGGYGSSGAYAGGSSGGYAAAYGSSGGGYSAGYGSSGGLGSGGTTHVGPIRRLAARIHEHRAAKVAARGSNGGYGSSGAVAVYSGSYGSSGGAPYASSYGSSGGTYSGGSSGSHSLGSVPAVSGYYGGSSGYAAPAASYHSYDSYSPVMQSETIIEGDSGVVVEPSETIVDPAAEASIESDTALLTIAVPETATVVVNGLETTSRGEVRQFMSNGLKEGFIYTYVVEVKFADGAEPTSKTIKLRAGSTERLVFTEPESTRAIAAVGDAPETVVTLHVPADAKVNLAGNDTAGTGDVRTFRTRQLAEGQKWNDYTISVTVTVKGQAVTKEKTIDLVAGSDHDFTFDFADASLASR